MNTRDYYDSYDFLFCKKSEWYSNTMKNFSVNVLTAGHWPSYSPSPNLAYPEQVCLVIIIVRYYYHC
jgi:hypothetical protein